MFGLVANVVSDHALRTGAKVRVISSHQDVENAEVHGLNKSGRGITKYIAWKRLENVRAAFIPEKDRKFCRLWWADKSQAEKVAVEVNEMWKDVRIFHPDGRLLRDGISVGEALARKAIECSRLNRRMWLVSPIECINSRILELNKERSPYASEVK